MRVIVFVARARYEHDHDSRARLVKTSPFIWEA